MTDEGLVAIRHAWTEDGVEMSGMHFQASGHTMLPHPEAAPPMSVEWAIQARHPAGRRPRRWLAADAVPATSPTLAARRSSRPPTSYRTLLAYADEYRDQQGSTRAFTVSIKPLVPSSPGLPGYDPARLLDHIAELHDLGVDGIVVHCPRA